MSTSPSSQPPQPPSGPPAATSDFSPPSEIAAILSALIGGGRYGVKIRFPHALVMTSLFRRDLSTEDKIRTVVKLSKEHAVNLAAFATIYKTILALLKYTSRYLQQNAGTGTGNGNGNSSVEERGIWRSLGRLIVLTLVGGDNLQSTSNMNNATNTIPKSPGLPETSLHALIAGAVGGAAVWGRYSSINYQIILYLTSRIIVGGLTLARERGIPPFFWKGLTFDRSYRWAAAAVWGVVMVLFEECPHVLHPSLKRSMEEIYRYLPSFLAGKADAAGGAKGAAADNLSIPIQGHRPPPNRLETKNWPY